MWGLNVLQEEADPHPLCAGLQWVEAFLWLHQGQKTQSSEVLHYVPGLVPAPHAVDVQWADSTTHWRAAHPARCCTQTRLWFFLPGCSQWCRHRKSIATLSKVGKTLRSCMMQDMNPELSETVRSSSSPASYWGPTPLCCWSSGSSPGSSSPGLWLCTM